MIKDLVLQSRSYRRFYENEKISEDTLVSLIDVARFCPSAANQQPLKYRLVNDAEENKKLFSCLHWAMALPEWGGPIEGERPSAYIIILDDLRIAKNRQTDVGIAAQSIMLAASERGLGGCMLGAIDREKVFELFGLDKEKYEIELVLALGKPKETVKIVPLDEGGSAKYFRDEKQIHYVPKRNLDDIIVK
ncbi:nitroreductase family protein [Treponema parvum]|uniref:nitroreductase family protein n=1 Tax=Treponema parvum TaxID=138851 RepID=UPI001AEBE2FA|nr:nitroreductase family protein [Treponema parvum]QTQ16015.1 nitroreductase family protein [Treponema parvum]